MCLDYHTATIDAPRVYLTHSLMRTPDVPAPFDGSRARLTVFLVNRSQTDTLETTVWLDRGCFVDEAHVYVAHGPDIKSTNSFEQPHQVGIKTMTLTAERSQVNYTFAPHAVTALVCPL